MEISQEDFERVIEVVYKRGVVRSSSPFVSGNEIKDTVSDVYDFLKYDITASQPGGEANAESRCPVCDAPWDMKKHNACQCGACIRTA